MAVMRGERVRGTQAAFVVVAHRPERGAAELSLRSTRTVSFLISDIAESQSPVLSVRAGRRYFAARRRRERRDQTLQAHGNCFSCLCRRLLCVRPSQYNRSLRFSSPTVPASLAMKANYKVRNWISSSIPRSLFLLRCFIQFSNLCGTVYRQGNIVFTPDGNSVLSPVGNRVSLFDLVK